MPPSRPSPIAHVIVILLNGPEIYPAHIHKWAEISARPEVGLSTIFRRRATKKKKKIHAFTTTISGDPEQGRWRRGAELQRLLRLGGAGAPPETVSTTLSLSLSLLQLVAREWLAACFSAAASQPRPRRRRRGSP